MRERLYTSTVANTTEVAASATVVTLKAANNSRLGLSIYNDDGGANLKVKLGEAAGADDFGLVVLPGGYFEVPFGYVGIVTGIWDSASGSARVTEFI